MSLQIVGHTVLFGQEREAVFESTRGVYRFYIKYKSYIHVDGMVYSVEENNRQFEQTPGTRPREMRATIWVPVASPSIGFEDRSLVYLRGRLILPSLMDDIRDDDDADDLTVHVEVVSAFFKRIVSSVHWTTDLLRTSIVPEILIVGKILRSEIGTNRSLMLLIKTKDEVDQHFDEGLIA